MASSGDGISRREICTLKDVRRVAAMLDINAPFARDGDALPQGWHFFMIGADTPRSRLRADGFPGLGLPIPDLGANRLLLARREVTYHADIPIGAAVERRSVLIDISTRETAQGNSTRVTIAHELNTASGTMLVRERQIYALVDSGRRYQRATVARQPIADGLERTIVPDQILLFQYSALGFNSHLIHIDRDYARSGEGYPDLVVNGGLTTLLLTEFARTQLGLRLASVGVRYLAPLFAGRVLRMVARQTGPAWQLMAYDDEGLAAVQMDVTVQ